ncbi:MAG TPA: hypothetical protein VJ890_28425 [Vineibacter sp.]|nr:hypothetical protein [Vineibacter sp.]
MSAQYMTWRNSLAPKKKQDIDQFLLEAMMLQQKGRPQADVEALATRYIREGKLNGTDFGMLSIGSAHLAEDFPRFKAYVFQAQLQKTRVWMTMLTNVTNARAEVLRGIARNFR